MKIKFFILLVVLGVGAYLYYSYNTGKFMGLLGENKNKQAEVQDISSSRETDVKAPEKEIASANPQKNGTESAVDLRNKDGFSNGSEAEIAMAPDILVVETVYDGKVYGPAILNIKVGDVVVFKNESNGYFWPASAPHPIHTDYPEFDAKKGIPAGGKWQFTFDKIGNWKFHDHLNPGAFGVVNVTAK